VQNKPVDVGRLGIIRCSTAPEPRTTPDGQVRRDRDGNPQWITGLVVRQIEGRRADVIEVVTPVDPQGIAEGDVVVVENLWANSWEVDGRTGTSYRADRITPARPASPSSSTPSGGAAAGGAPSAARTKSAGGDS